MAVPRIGLGCTNFGDPLDEELSVTIVRAAYDLGVRFFDTADAYGDGRSELFLGRALRNRPRDEFVVATKFGSVVNGDTPAAGGARPEYIRAALDQSCRRLGLDHIDLYQLHEPDPSTPIEETIGALEDLRIEGRIRAYGASNLSVRELSASIGPHRFATIQTMWNILHPKYGSEVVSCAFANGIGVIPWFPLAGGLLSGKYERGVPFPPDTRYGRLPERIGFLADDLSMARVDELSAIAKAGGCTLLEAALGWLMSRPEVISVIPGAMSLSQLNDNVRACNTRISPDTLDALISSGT